MKQVFQRSALLLALILLLTGGLAVFCIRYGIHGSQWASFSANEHAYTDGRLSSGQILDRNGLVLYNATNNTYVDDYSLRCATLHAVGDEDGNISTGARAALSDHLVGFNPITGTVGNGNKVYLTIDAELSEAALNALGDRKGTVGVYNYQTGDILCMVSSPTFDPANPPEISDDDPYYEGVYLNRLLSAVYTPGSVFKVITAAAALENIPNIEERTFTCTGSLQIGDDVITCPYAHGEMDFYDAFAHSCNCAYAQMATELGGKTLHQYAEKAGLLSSHQVSGIDTAAGSFAIGSDTNLGWSGVGQYNDLVNPCSMMTLMGAIAAPGKAVQPHLIHKELTMGMVPLFKEKPHAIKDIWSEETSRTLRKMMYHSVDETYGRDNFGGLPICAKSGTAEVADGNLPHAWFVGFLDDPDHPLAFSVTVENGGGGADVAGPIASRVLQMAVDENF